MSVEIETDGNRIIARIPFRQKAMGKAIYGATPVWDESVEPKRFMHWSYPLTIDTCYAFRNTFEDDLLVGKGLDAWARQELRRTAELEDIRHGEGTIQLPRVAEEAPLLWEAIQDRRYQLAGAAWMASEGCGILGDDPGLGKTLQALAMLIETDARDILVACRKTATYNVWVRETRKWTPSIKVFRAQGDAARRELMIKLYRNSDAPRAMLIVNLEMMRAVKVEKCPTGNKKCDKTCGKKHTYESIPWWPSLHELEWDAIIVDESHNLLASRANIQSKNITLGRYGAMLIRRNLRPEGSAIALSGTPARSDLTKFWGTLNWCRPDVFTSFWRFATAHFKVTEGEYGKEVGTVPLNEEAFYKALRAFYLARDKTAAAPDLPPVIYAGTMPDGNQEDGLAGIWLEMEGRQLTQYNAMVQDAAAWVDGGRVVATGLLAEITRRRQFACSAGRIDINGDLVPAANSNKIDWVVDFCLERKASGNKVVIASSFTKLIEATADALRREGIETLTLTGKTTQRRRDELVQLFQDSGRAPVVIINSAAGGESITLDAADDLVFMDLPWTSDQAKQVEARIHRVSRIHNVMVWRLFSVGTVDEWIAEMTEDQRELLSRNHPQMMEEILSVQE